MSKKTPSLKDDYYPGDDIAKLWDKPNGFCGQCGSPLNQSMIGGYSLHDSAHAVSWACNATKEQIEAAIKASEENIEALKKTLASESYRKLAPMSGYWPTANR